MKIRDIALGVDPGVCPAAAGDMHPVAQDLGGRGLQRSGDGHGVFLHLPAMVGCPLIAQG